MLRQQNSGSCIEPWKLIYWKDMMQIEGKRNWVTNLECNSCFQKYSWFKLKSILCLTFFFLSFAPLTSVIFFLNELTFRFPHHSYSTFYTLSPTTLFIPLFFVSLADFYFISFLYILLLNVLFPFFWQSKTCLLYLWPPKFILHFFYRLRHLLFLIVFHFHPLWF